MLAILLLLLLASISPPLARSPTIALGVPATVVLRQVIRHLRGSALQVDVHPARVGFGGVLQSELSTDLFDAGFDLLDVVRGVVAFSDDAEGAGGKRMSARDGVA